LKIAFFEIDEWGKQFVADRLADHELLLIDGPCRPTFFARLAGCEIISPFIYSRVNTEALSAMPSLKLVATRSTGYDHIDLTACKARGLRYRMFRSTAHKPWRSTPLR